MYYSCILQVFIEDKKNGNNFISSQKSHDSISIGRSLSDNKLEKGKRETDLTQTHTSPHQHLSQPHTHTRQGRAATNAFTRWSIFAFRWSTDETVTGVSGGTFVCQCKWVSVCVFCLYGLIGFLPNTHTHTSSRCLLTLFLMTCNKPHASSKHLPFDSPSAPISPYIPLLPSSLPTFPASL